MSDRQLVIISTVVLSLAAIALRAPNMFNDQIVNDEMLHLESYRNRYRSNDIYPVFMEKAENRLSSDQYATLEQWYQDSPLVQRGLLVLTDGHPPVWPVLAEVSEAATQSSITTIRMVSLVASLFAIWFMYRLGRATGDVWYGLWCATLLCVWYMAAMYGAIARPYALGQSVTILAIVTFVHEVRTRPASPWRFLGTALLAQLTGWQAWALLGPMVLWVLFSRIRRGQVKNILGHAIWYIPASIVLLAYMRVQMMNPTLAKQGTAFDVSQWWRSLEIGGPFAQPGGMTHAGFTAGSIAFLVAVATGVAVLFCCPSRVIPSNEKESGDVKSFAIFWRKLLLALLIIGLVMSLTYSRNTRFLMILLLPGLLFAGYGLRIMLMTPARNAIAIIVLLSAFTALFYARPVNRFETLFTRDAEFREMGDWLMENFDETTDSWIVHPGYLADALYRYQSLPEPVRPTTEIDTRTELKKIVTKGTRYVVIHEDFLEESFPEYAARSSEFPRQRYSNDTLIIAEPSTLTELSTAPSE